MRDWPRPQGSPEQVRGCKAPRPAPGPPSCPALPTPLSRAPRTLPHPHLQAAAYDERFANAPTPAMSKLASLQEWNPDNTPQTQGCRAGQTPLTTRRPAAPAASEVCSPAPGRLPTRPALAAVPSAAAPASQQGLWSQRCVCRFHQLNKAEEMQTRPWESGVGTVLPPATTERRSGGGAGGGDKLLSSESSCTRM